MQSTKGGIVPGGISDEDRERAQEVRDELGLNDQVQLRGDDAQAPSGRPQGGSDFHGRTTPRRNTR